MIDRVGRGMFSAKFLATAPFPTDPSSFLNEDLIPNLVKALFSAKKQVPKSTIFRFENYNYNYFILFFGILGVVILQII